MRNVLLFNLMNEGSSSFLFLGQTNMITPRQLPMPQDPREERKQSCPLINLPRGCHQHGDENKRKSFYALQLTAYGRPYAL